MRNLPRPGPARDRPERAKSAGVLVARCDWTGRNAPEALLGLRERAHASSLTGHRRAEWVRTRLTAKAALRWATGTPAAEVLPEPDGAPRVVGAAHRTAVSLAHTGELAACAVAGPGAASLVGVVGVVGVAGVVGVDVEPVDARNDILLPRLLGRDEPPGLGPQPPPGLLATVLVAAKEAALKAYRRPSPALRDYRLRQEDDGTLTVRVATRPGREELHVWWTCRAGVVTAVCATSELPPEHRAVTVDQVLTALTGGYRTAGAVRPHAHRTARATEE